MRNVRVVSFKEGVIEAGTARLRTRREEVIQEDQLYPFAMTNHGAYLAVANMDKNLEIIGDLADPMVLKDLGWSVPEIILEEAGLTKTRQSVGGVTDIVNVTVKPEVPPVPAVVDVVIETKEGILEEEKPIPEAPPEELKTRDEPRSKKKHNR